MHVKNVNILPKGIITCVKNAIEVLLLLMWLIILVYVLLSSINAAFDSYDIYY